MDDHTDDKNMSENSNSCKVMSKLLLPQDLMLSIFHLLPVNCLIDSARYVSKHWAATFNQLDRRCLSSTPGIFIENRDSIGNSYFLEFKDVVNTRFETIYLPKPPNMGYLLATCHGILMLFAPDQHIFLANPILKRWLKLPRFPVSKKYICVKNQCTIAFVPRTAKFKLFFQDFDVVSGTPSYVFYVLTVGIDHTWKEIARKEAPRYFCMSWKPLYTGANDLYWITSEEIIVFDVDKEIIVREYPHYPSQLGLSIVLNYLWTGTHLSCMVPKRRYTEYEIHILDFDSGKWSLYHAMEPFNYRAAVGPKLVIRNVEFRLWINDHIIFKLAPYVKSTTFIHFSYNLKTKQFTKIEDIEAGYIDIWLHTNTLVPLPTTPA